MANEGRLPPGRFRSSNAGKLPFAGRAPTDRLPIAVTGPPALALTAAVIDNVLGSLPTAGGQTCRRLIGSQFSVESKSGVAYFDFNKAVPTTAVGIKGAASFVLGAMLPAYTKPHLSFADQLAILMERGLAVTDQTKAADHLQLIGYQRLTPYWQPFQQIVPDPADAMRTIRGDQFRLGAGGRASAGLTWRLVAPVAGESDRKNRFGLPEPADPKETAPENSRSIGRWRGRRSSPG